MVSCRSYYDLVFDYHTALNAGNYKKAQTELERSKFLKKKRNKILLNLELGKAFHLQQLYDSSNYFFNQADLLMDDRTVVADVSASVLVNEAITRYKGEDVERVLIHYYKALNYLYLNEDDDALVEAKRINLRLAELGDKQLMDGKRYKSDAFAHTLQGFVYERLNDYNNAFIAYRNAYELYEKNTSLQYLGTVLPLQLQKDLINSAHKSGFYTDRDYYCDKFKMPFASVKDTAKNELLFIWENGLSPIKQQQDVFLFLVKGVGGDLMFADKAGTINIPVILPQDKNKKDVSLADFNMVHVAYPTYVDVPLFYTGLNISSNNSTYAPALAENVTFISHENLKERFLKEMTLTVSRLVLKKIAEAELKKENELAGALLGITGALTEKADTRNWQSLPSEISYTRIPVNKGSNTLYLKFNAVNGQSYSDTLVYKAQHRLNIINYISLQHLPPVLLR